MKKTLLSFMVLFSASAACLETDNYLVWDRILPDSGAEINDFMAGKIQEALAHANSEERIFSCEEITFRIARQFKTTPGSKSLEEFVGENLSKDNIYPTQPKFLEMSILSNTRFYLKYSGLSPNLQIGGYYFGADKLSHFASTGRRYYRRYLRMKKKGYSEDEAVEAAIRYGLLNERSVLGWWASGVFSYADMEANYQGLRYYMKMCSSGETRYLSQNEAGKWELAIKPDVADYVSGYWDETFNHSYFSKKSWKEVRAFIGERYCEMRSSPMVKERIRHYQDQQHTSYSLKYIKELQRQRKSIAPIPNENQSIEEFCAEQIESMQ